ncbi:MAG: hypothetical protein PHN31_06590, partial [Candidatus Gracilibacteria bacterium]|nr:hypothetical protein [Candidatus Gracilibacteria bacterium]
AAFSFVMYKDIFIGNFDLGDNSGKITFENKVKEVDGNFGKLVGSEQNLDKNVSNPTTTNNKLGDSANSGVNSKNNNLALENKIPLVKKDNVIKDSGDTKVIETNITDNKEGFGNLANGSDNLNSSLLAKDSVSDGFVGGSISGDRATGLGGGGGSTMSMLKTFSPDTQNYVSEIYRFSFSGDLNLELKGKMPVYKKEKKVSYNTDFSNSLKKLNFAGVDIGSFGNIGVSNISFVENDDFGLNIFVDFENSSLSMYRNWLKWPQTDYEQTSKNVLLDENEILSISNDFLSKHKIDLSKYGKPKVETSYVVAYKNFISTNTIPEYSQNFVNVVYPLIIDGNEVVEESGENSGVRIEVSLADKKVSGLNGLVVDNYLKSDYDTEENTKNILKVANVGGKYGFNNALTENAKYIDLKLKNPKLKYVSSYIFRNNVNQLYLIPSIVFEVEKDGNSSYYSDYVIVPLVKDFYKYDETGNIVGASE